MPRARAHRLVAPVIAAITTAVVAFGCATPRQNRVGSAQCTNWKDDVKALVAKDCTSCHSGTTPAAGYSLTTYLGALGTGSNATPNAVVGDPASTLLTTVSPDSADSVHAPFTSSTYSTLRSWVVDCELAYSSTPIHPAGILNPASPDFHGQLLKDSGWNFGLCAKCHGSDFSGGTAGVACTRCHTKGPTSCTTCHGQPPDVGAHITHVEGASLGKTFACSECHVVPTTYRSPGHLFLANGQVYTGPPIVTFSAQSLASTTLPGFTRTGPPTWDSSTQTCTNVYCHGDTFGDTNATNTTPHWYETGTGQAKCGTCHGLPPSDHSIDQCQLCHSQVVDANRHIINTELHVDGMIEIGKANSGKCDGCHGQNGNPMPPPDLEGDTLTTAMGVGAHASHVEALHGLRGPIPCSDCHIMPTEVTSPGHIDHPLDQQVVFPASSLFTGLAKADGANPTFDPATGQCTSYCHGGGTGLQADQSPSKRATVSWTAVGQGQASCGTCHGIPPQDGQHSPTLTLHDCATCHPSTVDTNGKIIITDQNGTPTSTHIDGVVEHVP